MFMYMIEKLHEAKDSGLNRNMDFLFFFKGVLVGFAMAIPIGPIGIICIRKT